MTVCQTLEKYKLGQEWLFSWNYRPGKRNTQVKTFVFKIFWLCTEADNGECKLWGQDIWRGWPIAKLGKKGRRTCQDCQGERLVRTLYKARRTHIANEKDPHSKASSACNCDQAPGHTRMPKSQARWLMIEMKSLQMYICVNHGLFSNLLYKVRQNARSLVKSLRAGRILHRIWSIFRACRIHND